MKSDLNKNDFVSQSGVDGEQRVDGEKSDAERREDAKIALEKEIEQFIRQERASRLRMAVFFTLGVIFFAVVGALLFSTADQMLKLPIDIEKGEQEVAESTNDPKCRTFITSIEDIGREYKMYAPTLQNLLELENVSQLQQIIDTLAGFRAKLSEEQKLYPKANFRFDDAFAQLKKWFRYTDNEISILEDLASYRKEEILKKQNQKVADAGEEVIILKKDAGKKVGAARIQSLKKKPEELLLGALLASQEAFETFRVWHTGGLHPCGAADLAEPKEGSNNG